MGFLYFFSNKKRNTDVQVCFSPANVGNELFFLFNEGLLNSSFATQPASNYSIHHWLLSQQGVTHPASGYSIRHTSHSQQGVTEFVIGYSTSKGLINSSLVTQPARS